MDPTQYLGLRCPLREGVGTPQPPTTNPAFSEPHPLLGQYPHGYHVSGDLLWPLLTQTTIGYNHLSTLPAGVFWHQPSEEHGLLAYGEQTLMGISQIPPQRTEPSRAERATQTDPPDVIVENHGGGEQPHARSWSTTRHLAPQEAYISPRQTAFTGPDVIDFVVNGEAGIRLSDASEGNWIGLEGRDDRSLFGSDQPQITLRLQFVGCLPWQSRISTTDFTKKRRQITRMKLAAEVTKSVGKFITREKSNGHEAGQPQCRWGDVSLRDVFLTRIVRVSTGSWQPELHVEQPSTASQAEGSTSSSLL